MAKRISVDARRELVRAIVERYREAAREDKLRILDEFVAVTGYHRKHSIRVLNDDSAVTATVRAPRLRLYDDAVREALLFCGKPQIASAASGSRHWSRGFCYGPSTCVLRYRGSNPQVLRSCS